jgi:hypothetical protein
MADAPLLTADRLGVSYGHVRAVEAVDLLVQPG